MRSEVLQFQLEMRRAGEHGDTQNEQMCSLSNPLRKGFVWSQKSEAAAAQKVSQLKSNQRALLLSLYQSSRKISELDLIPSECSQQNLKDILCQERNSYK